VKARTPESADDVTAFFWRGAAEGTLLVLRCMVCRLPVHIHPDVAVRAGAGAVELEPTPVSGYGSVYSFTVVRQAFDPAFPTRSSVRRRPGRAR